MLQDEDQVVEHGTLVEPGRAAEVAQETAASNHHLMGWILEKKIYNEI